jgi:EpsI family protein
VPRVARLARSVSSAGARQGNDRHVAASQISRPLPATGHDGAAPVGVPSVRQDRGAGFPAVGSAAVLVVLLFATGLAFRETVGTVLAAWSGPDLTYQHGLLVLLLCALIAWREWTARAGGLQARPSPPALALLALASLVWGLATLAAVEIVQLHALFLVLALLPLALLGSGGLRILAFPLALLVAVWPVWDFLQPVLQEMAARGAAGALASTGMPLHRTGTAIHVSSGVFLIERACSGLMFTLSGMLAGLLFAYIERLGAAATLAVTAGAALVASVGNVLRIATVIYLGEATRMQHVFVTDDHSAFGWAVYAACTIAFLLLVRSRLPARRRSAPSLPAALVSTAERRRVRRGALIGLAAIAVGPALVHAYRPDPHVAGLAAIELPAVVRGWHALAPADGAEAPVRLPADAALSMHYRSAAGASVTLHLADYAYQRPGSEAVSLSNAIYDGRYWTPVDTRIRLLDDGTSVRETRLRSPHGAERLVWRWYLVGARPTGRDHEAKALNVWGTLVGDPAVALVAVVADDAPGQPGTADARLARFVDDTRDAVATAIRRERDARHPGR